MCDGSPEEEKSGGIRHGWSIGPGIISSVSEKGAMR